MEKIHLVLKPTKNYVAAVEVFLNGVNVGELCPGQNATVTTSSVCIEFWVSETQERVAADA